MSTNELLRFSIKRYIQVFAVTSVVWFRYSGFCNGTQSVHCIDFWVAHYLDWKYLSKSLNFSFWRTPLCSHADIQIFRLKLSICRFDKKYTETQKVVSFLKMTWVMAPAGKTKIPKSYQTHFICADLTPHLLHTAFVRPSTDIIFYTVK